MAVDLNEVCIELGKMWELGRPVAFTELARALRMSETGGGYLGKLSKKGPIEDGAMLVSIEAMLDGWRPRNFDDIVRPDFALRRGKPKG
jgi:hypothetical protein